MKKSYNYSAWNIDTVDVDSLESDQDKLRYFSKYAVLAPSGHNTQPWLFQFKSNYLLITVNKSQELPHSGKVAAEPYVSIGACVETLIQAGRAFGYELTDTISYKPELSVKISISRSIKPEAKRAEAIKNRVSNREFYDPNQVDGKIINLLTKSTQAGIRILAINKTSDIKFVAEKTAEATIKIMTEPAFRAELSRWVRNNITRQHDGMPAFVQGMPTPPSLIAKHIIKNIDISKGQAKKDSARILHSGALILIGVDRPGAEAFYYLGREYTRICIDAELHGYSTSGVGAGVIDTDIKQDIKVYFNMSSLPSALIRVGKTTKKAHHSPRYTLDMVTVK